MMTLRASLNSLFICLIIFNHTALAKDIPTPVLEIPKSPGPTQKEYLKHLALIQKKYCTRKAEAEFEKLSKKNMSIVTYVPESSEGGIDLETIKNGLPELESKWNWLNQTLTRLQAQKDWTNLEKHIGPVEDSIGELLKLKEQYFLISDKSEKTEVESKALVKKLKNQFEVLINELYFFSNYLYPVDHLGQRRIFDINRVEKFKENSRLANKVMFQRKLQEDGAYDSDHKNSDMLLRTTLNTLSFRLAQEGPWLSEENRYDLEWAIYEMRKFLRSGKGRQIRRMKEWMARLAQTRSFYEKLLDEKKGQSEKENFVKKQEASGHLRDFVYSANAKVYKELLQLPELMQALYAFDQILLHEVGHATSANLRDRTDVAQVVINSRFNPDLSVITRGESFYGYLRAEGVPEAAMKNPSWLNVMFKSLRFSFTLFNVPAVRHIYCPDFYKTAVNTRNKNLNLILNVLKNPQNDFKAIRYFSRESMVGRIDMSKVWDGFREIPERAGARYEVDSGLKKAIQQKKYRYLYSFKDPQKREHHVLKIGGKEYAMTGSLLKPDFYAYRNPHKFRFFEVGYW